MPEVQLQADKVVKTSRFMVHTGFLVNRVFLTFASLGLLMSLAAPSLLVRLLLDQSTATETRSELAGLRLMLLVGIAASIATDRLLIALTQILETTRTGDPFIAANAHRLQTIGWAVLALQLLDIPVCLIERFFPGMGASDAAFSPAGWMTVLMVFVLSRVFAVGSAMRDDLEGTV